MVDLSRWTPGRIDQRLSLLVGGDLIKPIGSGDKLLYSLGSKSGKRPLNEAIEW